jgi:hypothetical protein
VNVGLDSFKSNINRYIEEYNLILDPDFQRGHIWNEQQQISFVEFILANGSSGRELLFNHPGWMKNFRGDFVCVDGLQRITAILRYVDNEIKAYDSYYKDMTDHLPNCNDMIVTINTLKTRKEVLTWYIQLNSCGTPHSEEEIERVKYLITLEEK